MLSPLFNLFGKPGSRVGGPAAAGNGPRNSAPAWPAPERKPEPVVPKLSLARRHPRALSPLPASAHAAPTRLTSEHSRSC